MKRKTSDVPTRIYSYRCLPPLSEQKRVEDQFYLANRYRNVLVEIERRLRERIRDVQIAHPDVGPILAQYEGADAAVDDTYDELRAAKSGTATPNLDAHRERLAAEQEYRAECSVELRAIKLAHKETLVAGYNAARDLAHAEMLAARGDHINQGLRHGTYSRVEDAIKQAAKSTHEQLRFERYTGEGSIGTQLIASGRSGEAMGMTVSELHSMTDTRLRLQPLPDNYNEMPRNRRRHAARVRAWLRIGTVPDGRAPVFAEFPVTFHRPLPNDAVIKWAYVVRKLVGYHLEWRLQLTIESNTFRRPTQPIGSGACAIDLGWRRIFDDEGCQIGLRAGYLVDETGHEREIMVPEKLWRGMGKVTDLAQIRSKNMDQARDALVAWLGDRTPPEWMVDRIRGLPQWHAQRKLQALVDLWSGFRRPAEEAQGNRIEGDEAILTMLLAWAKQDRHLQNWQEHSRQRLIAHRRECWRVIATEIARKYAVILVEDGRSHADMMRLEDIPGWEQPAPEDGNPSDGREQRKMSRIAAVGELRAEIVKATSKTGARVEVAPTVDSTKECAWCSHVQVAFDARASITCTCEGCARIWDQDANAGRNLLHRKGFASGPVPPIAPPIEPEVLAPPMVARSRGNSGSSAVAMLSRAK